MFSINYKSWEMGFFFASRLRVLGFGLAKSVANLGRWRDNRTVSAKVGVGGGFITVTNLNGGIFYKKCDKEKIAEFNY